jgi:hypothetical protein
VSHNVADMSLAVAVKFMNMLLVDGFRSPHTLCGGCAVLVSLGFVQAGTGIVKLYLIQITKEGFHWMSDERNIATVHPNRLRTQL